MLIDAIDHVQLAMPPGGEPDAVAFYEDVLGLPQVPKPAALAGRGGCWFERGAVRVHLGVQEDFTAATKAHPAFAVLDLDRVELRLRAAGTRHERVEGPEGPQVYVWDPFGNRIELRPGRPSPPLPGHWDAILEAAVAAGDEADLPGRIAFVAELDRLKAVERRTFVLGGLRRENTAEHSFHVAAMALVLGDLAPAAVDATHVALMLLVHDLVEIDAGDVSIYDEAGMVGKSEREEAAATRLFGLLPHEVGRRLRVLWDEYEAAETAAARFAHAIDRLAPMLLNVATDGLAWRRDGVGPADVRRIAAAISDGCGLLGRFVHAVLDRAEADGALTQPQV